MRDGLWDSMEFYGSPMVFTMTEYEGVEAAELLRPIRL